jgi:hypothetical protein
LSEGWAVDGQLHEENAAGFSSPQDGAPEEAEIPSCGSNTYYSREKLRVVVPCSDTAYQIMHASNLIGSSGE